MRSALRAKAWRNQNQRKDPDGPPDLDQLFKKWFGGLFGHQGNQQTPPTGGQSDVPGKGVGLGLIVGVLVILAIIWALSGIYIVKPAERGVVLRFGAYHQTTLAGMHWYPRFVDSVDVQNVDRIMSLPLNALMLTSKENVVDLSFVVQYKIGDLKDYLFNVVNPEGTLQKVMDSAVRQVIGRSTIDEVITDKRTEVTEQVRQEVVKLLGRYKTGLVINDVTMQSATPPQQVKSAFDDVIDARNDQNRYKNQAVSYANQVVPVAKGKASRILQQAKAKAEQVVLQAKGQVAEFDALLEKYQKDPQIMKTRMYLDAMSDVYSHSHLVFMDGNNKNNIFYLPLASQGNTMATQPVKPVVTHTQNQTKADVEAPLAESAKAQANQTVNKIANYLRWQEAQS